MFHWLIVILSFANCVLIVQLFYCHFIVATAFCQFANKRICYIMLYYVTLLTYLLTKLYVCVCYTVGRGASWFHSRHGGQRDRFHNAPQSDRVIVAGPTSTSCYLTDPPLCRLSTHVLCVPLLCWWSTASCLQGIFSVFDFIVIIIISARCLGRVCIVITLQCTLARI